MVAIVSKRYVSDNLVVAVQGLLAQGSTPTTTFITNDVDTPLTNWAMTLATEYVSSPATGAKLLYVAFTMIVSFHEDLCDIARVGSPTTSRGTVVEFQWYVLLKATQSGLPTRTFTLLMTERS